jgi:hypothetical protein
MINEIDLIQNLSQYGVVEYCGYNNIENSSYIVAMNNVEVDKSIVDELCKNYINIEFLNNTPSTLEGGIYKIMFDNFPNS